MNADDEIAFGMGLFSMPLPKGWEFKRATPVIGYFRLPTGHVVRCDVWTVEDAEAIAAEDVTSYLEEDGMTVPVGPLETVLDNLLVGRHGPRADASERLLWKSVELFDGRLLRIVRIVHDSEGRLASDEAAGLLQDVAEALRRGRFAHHETPFDGVAITADLMVRNVFDRVFLRVPLQWPLLRDETDGRPYFEAHGEAVSPETTLWISYDEFTDRDTTGLIERIVGSFPSPAADVELSPEGAWTEHVDEDVEDGRRLRLHSFRRFLTAERTALVVHFNFSLFEEDADTPAGEALIDRVRRETQRAVVLVHPPGA